MSPWLVLGRLAKQSDERLMELVRAGNERAFEVLVQRYRPELLRYSARLGLTEARADDVLQHALLQAWLALQGATEVRELRPWLYRVVHNAAINAIRASARDGGSPAEVLELGSTAGVESELERRAAVREALSEVAALPQMQREAILLTAVEGRSHDEVASALGVTNGAVRGLLYRARSTLRSAAAAVAPQPLIGWAHSWLGRASSTIERLPLQGDGPVVLLKGAAMAATAALVVGATVGPLHGPGAHRVAASAPSTGQRRALTRAETASAPSRTAAVAAVRKTVPSPPRAEGARRISSTVAQPRSGVVPVTLAPTRERTGPASGRVVVGQSAPAQQPAAAQVSVSSPVAPVQAVQSSSSSTGAGGPVAGVPAGTSEAPAEKPSAGTGGSNGGDSGSGESGGSDDPHGGESTGGGSDGSGSDHESETDEAKSKEHLGTEPANEGERDN